MNEDEQERLRRARLEIAQRLGDVMKFALGVGLISEAAIIAKLIEATLTNTTTAIHVKLK